MTPADVPPVPSCWEAENGTRRFVVGAYGRYRINAELGGARIYEARVVYRSMALGADNHDVQQQTWMEWVRENGAKKIHRHDARASLERVIHAFEQAPVAKTAAGKSQLHIARLAG